MDASRHARYAPLATILLLATILQAIVLGRLSTISADGIIFIDIARDLAEAPIETIRAQDQHPGYPAMLLACTRAVEWLGYRAEPGSWIAGGVIVSFVCGLLSVAVVWFFARDLFDEKIANVAAIVFIVLPVPRTNAVDAQSDTPHALVYLLAAWMATTGITNGNLWRLAAAGLASGVAFWIRPEGLEVVLVAIPLLAWHAFRAHWSWPRRVLAVGTLAGTALVVVAPYTLLAGKITSKQLPGVQARFVQLYQNPAPAPESAQSAVTRVPEKIEQPATSPPSPALPRSPTPAAVDPSSADAPMVDAPAAAPTNPVPAPPAAERRYSAAFILSVIGGAISAFINSICQGFKFVFIPLYLLGDVALAWHRPRGIQIGLLSLLGATHIFMLMCLHGLSGYIAHRHVIPLVGLAMPFVALGVVQLGTWAALVLKTRPVYGTLATLAISCSIVMPYTLRRLNREFVPVIEATRWIQSRARPGSGIVCNSPYVGFYGTLPVAMLDPKAPTLDEALARAPAGAQYDYVVLHVGAHAYQPEWVDQLARVYRQVRVLPDPYSHNEPGKVLVFQSQEGRVRHAARGPRP